MKKILVIILLFLTIGVGIVYYYRNEIFQVSAESVIKNNLPSYITVGEIIFDLDNGTLEIEGLRVSNPRGYKDRFLAEIDAVKCKYQMKGDNILDGIVVTEIVAQGPVINIERLASKRINVNEMSQLMDPVEGKPAVAIEKIEKRKESDAGLLSQLKDIIKSFLRRKVEGVNISDIIKLPDSINIEDGELIFLDGVVSSPSYRLTFEDLNGTLGIKLNDDYRKVLYITSKGTGYINGNGLQEVNWDISIDPTAKDLLMSNRYEVSNTDIKLFQPYYGKYAPIIVEKGRFSGTLVFNFDNGNIGSINTVVFNGLKFKEKKTGSRFGSWNASMIPDAIRYLSISSDEILFDFKITGSMDNPKFDLGPKTYKRMRGMVVNKALELLGGGEQSGGQGGAGLSNVRDDVGKIIDTLKDLF